MSTPVEIRRHTGKTPWTYALLDQRQRQIAARLRQGGEGALLLSELSPVITLGRRARVESLLLSESALASRGVSVYPTDRGGFETYHGPGQWVLFAVDRLERMTGDPRGIQSFIQALLEIALTTAQNHGVKAEIREGAQLGVWTPQGKLASVGIHVEDGVVLHGLSLNVFRTETSFLGLKPCGLDAAVDYLAGGANFESARFAQVGEFLRDQALRRLWRESPLGVDAKP